MSLHERIIIPKDTSPSEHHGSEHETAPETPRALPFVRELLRQRFELAENLDDRLPYHNGAHTEGVVRRALKIAEALGASKKEMELVEIAAAFHDSVQEWEESVLEGGVIKRKRFITGNEQKSAVEAIAWMKQYPERFTEEDCEKVREAIETTIPDFSPSTNTVVQPRHTKESSLVARAVGFADIGTAGMEPETFAREGVQLFAEEHLDIVRAIRTASSPDDILEQKQKEYLARYRAWMDFQIKFAHGRQTETLNNLGDQYYYADEPERGQILENLFSRFDESIAIAEKNAQEAHALTFEQMARRLVPGAFEQKEVA